MELTGEKVSVRPYREGDLADFYRYAGDAQVAVAAGMTPVTDLAQARQLLKRQIAQNQAQAIVYSGQVVGTIGIYPYMQADGSPDSFAREIGYALRRDLWGQGLTGAAVKLVCAHLFAIGITAIWAAVRPENFRSVALLKGQGFTPEFTIILPEVLSKMGPIKETYYRLTDKMHENS